jgi:hypothetical protein
VVRRAPGTWVHSCEVTWQHIYGIDLADAHVALHSDLYSTDVDAPPGSWCLHNTQSKLEHLMSERVASALRAATPADDAVEPAPLAVQTGLNAGRYVFRRMAVTVRRYYLAEQQLTPQQHIDPVPAVVAHVDHSRRTLHLVCPSLWADRQAADTALQRYLNVYRGDKLPQWADWWDNNVVIPVDHEALGFALEAPPLPQE